MSDPITLPAADFPDVIREGCALVLTSEYVVGGGFRRHPGHPLTAIGGIYEDEYRRRWVETDEGMVPLDALAIDLLPGRASGQWAVAMWWRSVPRWPASIPPTRRVLVVSVMGAALFGRANPVELRRVALEVRGG